jgi:hypothetical protein
MTLAIQVHHPPVVVLPKQMVNVIRSISNTILAVANVSITTPQLRRMVLAVLPHITGV